MFVAGLRFQQAISGYSSEAGPAEGWGTRQCMFHDHATQEAKCWHTVICQLMMMKRRRRSEERPLKTTIKSVGSLDRSDDLAGVR